MGGEEAAADQDAAQQGQEGPHLSSELDLPLRIAHTYVRETKSGHARTGFVRQFPYKGMGNLPSLESAIKPDPFPAIVRVRARRKGLFAGQASFGRSVSKTEWVYGFKVALSVSPEGVVTAFGLAPANSDERPIGEFLVRSDGHRAFMADKGFASRGWERRWLKEYGALVAATPPSNARRAWSKEVCHWAAGKRQVVEGVIWQLKDLFGLERHRAKTLGGLLTRLAAKVAAYTCGQALNAALGRPLRNLASLLV